MAILKCSLETAARVEKTAKKKSVGGRINRRKNDEELQAIDVENPGEKGQTKQASGGDLEVQLRDGGESQKSGGDLQWTKWESG